MNRHLFVVLVGLILVCCALAIKVASLDDDVRKIKWELREHIEEAIPRDTSTC